MTSEPAGYYARETHFVATGQLEYPDAGININNNNNSCNLVVIHFNNDDLIIYYEGTAFYRLRDLHPQWRRSSVVVYETLPIIINV